ncbi:unnamed protein product (macronuclear) [Paramecium tetraurelia]|uniref:Uncharacterized protein n=1 Tax=Paramecium tetraurelia TaxID=5888 RepID=A0CW71_PARTE|nr:uncharacterized protein GSPATT00001240001 [Paramecium tetraurelia]CAK75038.1 unnamed protein product [Paramecium tetraurelia]
MMSKKSEKKKLLKIQPLVQRIRTKVNKSKSNSIIDFSFYR